MVLFPILIRATKSRKSWISHAKSILQLHFKETIRLGFKYYSKEILRLRNNCDVRLLENP